MCLGAMMFGTAVDKETSFNLLDVFLDEGGTFSDTSNNYAHWAGTGDESETLLGECCLLDTSRCVEETVFSQLLRNTLVLSVLKLIFCFPMPILLAIMLHEMSNRKYKKFVQTVSYMPVSYTHLDVYKRQA